MPLLARLLTFVFIQSIAATIMERCVYFYTKYELHFTDTQNLWLALSVGVAYILGALSSHRVTLRLGEKTLLLATLVAQIICALAVWQQLTPGRVIIFLTLYAFFNAMMWPVAESYASAGRTPSQSSRAIGFYNMAWSFAVPLALWLSGPIIQWWGAHLFTVSAGASVFGGLFVLTLPKRPLHSADHPALAMPPQRIDLYRRLMFSSRWSLVASYAMVFVLSPLMPEIFKSLGFSVAIATLLAGCLDAARAATFVVMMTTERWHGRRDLLIWTALLLPVGFLIVLYVPFAPAIVLGGIVFGIAAGLAYYSALYYAMVESNAAVHAGGAHEALIGSGFALGPIAALAGRSLGALWAMPTLGVFAGILPMILAGAIGAIKPVWQRDDHSKTSRD